LTAVVEDSPFFGAPDPLGIREWDNRLEQDAELVDLGLDLRQGAK